MKKVFCLIMSALLLFALFGCTDSPQAPGSAARDDGEDAVKQTAVPDGEVKTPTEAPTEAPDSEAALRALLPDWPANRIDEEGAAYSGVSAAQLDEYISLRESEGFIYMEGALTDTAKILARDDAWIEIWDNTGTDSSCVIQVTLDTPAEGVDRAKVKEAILNAEYYWADREGPEGDVLRLLDITPEGLYESTGLAVFRTLYGTPAVLDRTRAKYFFSTRTFIVGAGSAKEIRFYDIVSADIDSDGENEAVVLEPGFTSGLFSLIFEAFGIENGELERLAISGYTLDFGLSSLAAHDGRAYYVWEEQLITPGDPYNVEYAEPKEFELTLVGGELFINDPDDLLGSGLVAHFD